MRKYKFDLESQPVNPETIAGYDCILIVTDHDDVDYEMIGTHARLIVDTRNAMNRVPAELVKARCVKA